MALVLGVVVAHKLLVALAHFYPVAVLDRGGVAGALLLLLHLGVKLLLVDREAVLAADKLSEVEGEAVSVKQAEGLDAVKLGLALGLELVHSRLEHVDALLQGTQERVFLLFHDAAYEFALCGELGVSLAHLLDEHGEKLVDEGLLLAEEGVCVTDGAAQDTADDVACLGVRGQLAVGDGEGYGTQVVGHHAHGHVGVLVYPVFQSGKALLLVDKRLEDVGIVVRVLALEHAHQALEAHTGIDNVHGQRLEAAVGLAVELHEHDVPDLDDLRVVLVDKVASGHVATLALGARVDVYLGAGATGACVAHLPEVVVLVAVDDVVGRQVLGPVAGGLVIAGNILFGRALENSNIQILGVKMQHVDEIFPGVVDSSLLEVVAEAPVAEHLKHGMVVSVVAHLLQVVVLAAHAQAFLRVGAAAGLGVLGTQYDVLPLVHARISKHQRGVVLDNHRCRRDDNVSFRLEEFFVRVTDFICCHHICFCFNMLYNSIFFQKLLQRYQEMRIFASNCIKRCK